MPSRTLQPLGALLLAALALLSATAQEPPVDQPPILDVFRQQADGDWRFQSDDWSLTMRPGAGIVSLLVDGAEFLRPATKTGGAGAFRLTDGWIQHFPDHSTIYNAGPLLHVERQIAMVDGAYMIRPVCDGPVGSIDIAAVYNGDHPARFILYLSDDIQAIRMGTHDANGRADARELDAMRPVKSAVIVHRDGRSIRIDEPCLAGRTETPDGQTAWAVAFDCRERQDPTMSLRIDRRPLPAHQLYGPRFDVHSSDDPEKRSRDFAIKGVTNPVYRPDTQLDFGLRFQWRGADPFQGFAELEITHALGQPHFRQRLPLADLPAGDHRVTFQPRFHLPGVSEVHARICDPHGRVLWTARYRMLYDPEHYQPDIRRPADFDAFWDDTLRQLAEIPLDPTIERVDEYRDHPTQEIYQLSFTTWGGQRIYAGLYVPRDRSGPLGAQLVAHPNMTGFRIQKDKDGLYGSREHERTGHFVQIAPFIRGHVPDAPDIPPNEQWWGDMSSRDSYVARSWYSSMVRAVDYLATRPDLVDMDRVWVSGGSQGGALALVAAGLDPRLRACFAMCPAACQMHEILSAYPSFGPKIGQAAPGQTLEELKTVLSYYDAVNFAPRIRVETAIGFNVGDTTVHSMGPLAAWHALTALPPEQKHLFIGHSFSHGGPDSYNTHRDARIATWTDAQTPKAK